MSDPPIFVFGAHRPITDDEDSTDDEMPSLIPRQDHTNNNDSTTNNGDDDNMPPQQRTAIPPENNNNSDDSDSDMPTLLPRHAIQEDSDSDDDDDDYDDEDDDEGLWDEDEESHYPSEDEEDHDFECPMLQQLSHELLMQGVPPQAFVELMSMAAATLHHNHDSDNDEDDTDEDFTDLPPLVDSRGGRPLPQEEEEQQQQQDGPTCAICFEHMSGNRRFVTLPCCGGDEEFENNATTRFCNMCLRKCLKPVWDPVNTTMQPFMTAECPRCRQFIVKEDVKEEYEVAAVDHIVKSLGANTNMAYRYFFLMASYCPHNFIPKGIFERLELPMESMAHLVRYGLFRTENTKYRGEYYTMDPDDQAVMRNWLDESLTLDSGSSNRLMFVDVHDDSEEHRNIGSRRSTLIGFVSCSLGQFVLENGRNLALLRCLPVVSHLVVLALIVLDILPHFSEWTHPRSRFLVKTQLVVTFLLVLQSAWYLLFAVMPLLHAYLTAKWVAEWLKREDESSAYRKRLTWMLIAAFVLNGYTQYSIFSWIFFGGKTTEVVAASEEVEVDTCLFDFEAELSSP